MCFAGETSTPGGLRRHGYFEIRLVNGTEVAVLADRFWTAKRARDRLKID